MFNILYNFCEGVCTNYYLKLIDSELYAWAMCSIYNKNNFVDFSQTKIWHQNICFPYLLSVRLWYGEESLYYFITVIIIFLKQREKGTVTRNDTDH